jgi:nitrogen fixation/metabolism regulation signal transduction histidine kinase
MRSPFRTHGFERRLIVFFLLLSLPPTLLIAFVSTRYFMQSIRLVSNPTVEQSFTNSMEIARDFSAKLEEDSHCAVVRLRDEYRRAGSPAPGPALAEVLAAVGAETHADFTAIYLLEGESWLLKQAHPEGFGRLDARAGLGPADGGGAITSSLAQSDPDVVASGIVADGVLFVAGYALDRGFTEKMRRTGDDLGRYRAVGLYVSALRRYIIIATSVLVVLIAVASALFSRAIARRISQPITELARATDRVAKGDLDHRVTVAARDEVASLVTGFNRMTEELQENKRNLIRAERIAAWRDVARRIAHEIKNPLTPIEIAIYRIKKRLEAQDAAEAAGPQAPRGDRAQDGQPRAGADRAPTDRPQTDRPQTDRAQTDHAAGDRRVIEESLDSILKEVTALKTIAQEFSAFAKMPEPKMTSFDINDVLRSVLELYASSSQQVEMEMRLGPRLPTVKADRDQMRSVFSNLVKNAFEAMPSGGTLTVTTAAGEPGYVRVEIADTGTGIPDDIKDKVFDPYFTTKPSGTGVGLALAYRILADHNGKISFRTGATGTSFIVDLPVET